MEPDLRPAVLPIKKEAERQDKFRPKGPRPTFTAAGRREALFTLSPTATQVQRAARSARAKGCAKLGKVLRERRATETSSSSSENESAGEDEDIMFASAEDHAEVDTQPEVDPTDPSQEQDQVTGEHRDGQGQGEEQGREEITGGAAEVHHVDDRFFPRMIGCITGFRSRTRDCGAGLITLRQLSVRILKIWRRAATRTLRRQRRSHNARAIMTSTTSRGARRALVALATRR
ncbi:unnamed protein product [Amoebophrya sp. A120]|nr:unnamed protein product [Amoebophrya sp. A120]|eukprot:GSA120T00020886001.1